MDYIDYIQKAREAKNISQRQFSKMLGLAEITYGAYERRQRKMDVEMFVKVCKLLDLSADEILGLK
ncbi:helix-turn-helix domain-containing protein [Agathobaculum sp.]|uniref:helix-turn-helix domain-containing protein n=1 Tax=Agathobaculum sp. TaxID=2048138 RepID=UPI002A813500|nr:helix-turn-helix transcriptional regulator [Agathobaculum sp.]MDY3618306.1 helix-turn-helix transcriptional regulator [Agathobaculum sp.]